MHMILLAIPLLIPLLIDIAAIWSWRGGYRYVAMIPLPFLVLAFAVDLNSMIQGGNLTGLFSIMAAAPSDGPARETTRYERPHIFVGF